MSPILTLLNQAAQSLATFLSGSLPRLSENWWEEFVLKALNPSQSAFVEKERIQRLEGLDLAALLKVLDQNWYCLSQRHNFGHTERNFVKEMQTIRNRWAHLSVAGIDTEDLYRDLDTLQRFVEMLEEQTDLAEQIRSEKRRVRAALDKPQPTSTDAFDNTGVQEQSSTSNLQFQVGDRVCLKADENTVGAVIGADNQSTEPRYQVFVNGQTKHYYQSQLLPFVEEKSQLEIAPLRRFNSHLSGLQIRHPSTAVLYSLNAARIEFIPYQFRPVLKFIRSDRPRMLIADEVGVGKTIEAGLILREMQARRTINSVLIICPRPLVAEQKWLREMKRFDESFTQLDGPDLRICIDDMDNDGEWPSRHLKTILPYSLFTEQLLLGSSSGKKPYSRGLLSLDPPPRFDLVIVDEAHHLRNSDSYNHKAARFFCDHAEAVLFLTATPIQLATRDLFVLLNLLRPDMVIDEKGFESMSEPNPYINQAIQAVRSQRKGWQETVRENLLRAGQTGWGRAILTTNPTFQDALRIGYAQDDTEITAERRIRLIREIEELHTFSRIINRTRRRDIGDFTVRKPETVMVQFTPAQRKLHDDLLETQAQVFQHINPDVNINFLMSTIRRQAASSLYGLAPLIEDILTRRLDDLAWSEMGQGEWDGEPTWEQRTLALLQERILSVLEQAEALDGPDPKLEALLRIIADKQTQPNHRIILFTCFRHTLRYLGQKLTAAGYRIGTIYGDIPDHERIELRQRFQLPKEDPNAIDLLLFTEVGSEGLDYQFCDCMVNYDLPWNPMRVEQRIGRIDRRGQRSEQVSIFNLIMENTVDADIYNRCLLRIGIFHKAIGASEEILGQISREIQTIGENFRLTESERRARLEQLADNQIRLLQEQQSLEQKQRELFGIELPEQEMQNEIQNASSYWLTADALRNLIEHYLVERTGRSQEYILGDKPLKTLRLSQDARSLLLRDFESLPRQTSPGYRQWEKWLKGGEPHLSITFDAETAMDVPDAALITPLHPLAKQAAQSVDLGQPLGVAASVVDDDLPHGTYPFAIYEWQYHGLRDDLHLVPIANLPELEPRLVQLLIQGQDLPTPPDLQDGEINQLEERQYTRWQTARSEHQQKIAELVAYRRESLEVSHQARLTLLHDQLAQSTNDKIRRMRESQIATARADYERRVEELNAAIDKAEITAQPVAFGIIQIQSAGAS